MARWSKVVGPRWIKLFTQAHWSHSQYHTNNGFFKLVGSIATDPLVLLFTQYKNTWATAISSHYLDALPTKDV